MLEIALVIALLSGTPASATAESSDAASLIRAFQQVVRDTKTPGATAALVQHGELVWAGAAGSREVDRHSPMSPTDLFPIASATKTVTAAMTMRLVESGRLGLDETIEGVLPGLPNADRITVRMLLDHSSGLVDYFADGDIARIIARDPFHEWTREEVLSHVGRAKFPPGSRHSYSNTNYIVLGAVLERHGVGGIEAQFDEAITTPLGLDDATFVYDDALLPRLAHPHSGGNRRPFRDLLGDDTRIGSDYWDPVWTDGGLVADAAELALFGNSVFAGDLLAEKSVETMLPAKRGGWGLGTFDTTATGRRWIGHDGLYGGYASENWTDRERGLTLVVLTNAHGYERGVSASAAIWRRLAAILHE